MISRFSSITPIVGFLLASCLVSAQDWTSETGLPEEMKKLHPMNGNFDFELKFKVDPSSSDWEKTKGRATVELLLDGAAQQMSWGFDMMGKKVEIIDVLTYDREARIWKRSSVDNLSARMTISEGEMVEGKLVLAGRDMMQGMELQTRQTISRISERGFEWQFEMSMDGGKNYVIQMMATFTKV